MPPALGRAAESTMQEHLRLAALIALGWAPLALVVQFVFLRARGSRTMHAKPAGSPSGGLRHALAASLLPGGPWGFPGSLLLYLATLAFHAGMLAGLILLGALVFHAHLSTPVLHGLGIVTLLGLLAALYLLLRRVVSQRLRALSIADDHLSGFLAAAFLGLAAGRAVSAAFEPWFLLGATLLLLYLPVGKLRHGLYFLLSRTATGAFFGRRGVLHPGRRHG